MIGNDDPDSLFGDQLRLGDATGVSLERITKEQAAGSVPISGEETVFQIKEILIASGRGIYLR